MQKHTKNYLKHFNIGEQDVPGCEICPRAAVDIHHIVYRSAGGGDEIDNLIGLCRDCHELAHEGVFGEEFLLNVVAMRKEQ